MLSNTVKKFTIVRSRRSTLARNYLCGMMTFTLSTLEYPTRVFMIWLPLKVYQLPHLLYRKQLEQYNSLTFMYLQFNFYSFVGPTKFPGNLVVVAEEEGLPATPPTSPRRSPNDSPIESSTVRDRLCRRSSFSFSRRPPPLHSKANVTNLEVREYSEENNSGSQEMTRLPGGDIPDDTLNTCNKKDIPTSSQSHNGQNVEENHLSPTAVSTSSTSTDDTLIIQCGQCKKHFTQRSMLHTHICSNKTSQPYQCGHCDERFSSPGEMTIHVAIHQDKKPFKCGYCSRSFTGATTLNNHVRMHTGEKPFDCFRCGKTFTKGLQLSKHQKDNCVPCMKYMHNS